MVEMKSGDTYNGKLENIDKYMNIKLSDVTFTSKVVLIKKIKNLQLNYKKKLKYKAKLMSFILNYIRIINNLWNSILYI